MAKRKGRPTAPRHEATLISCRLVSLTDEEVNALDFIRNENARSAAGRAVSLRTTLKRLLIGLADGLAQRIAYTLPGKE